MAEFGAEEFPKIPAEDVEKLKAAVEKGNLTEVAARAKEALEMVDKITLNIAVTGETGTGKSSFVNAIRGLGDDEKDSAKTGIVESTFKPTPYRHPTYPNVIVWDLPGVQTTKFEEEMYLQQMGFRRYDFFIIISSNRFTPRDVQLVQEIKRQGKKYYFVRSKVDQDLRNEKRRNVAETVILNAIRENCVKGLKKEGEVSPQVFLMSRLDLAKYDFLKLQETLVDELPNHKKFAFLRSLSNISKATVEKKKQELQKDIWLKSLASSGLAAVPVPGLSLVCDISILMMSLKEYCRVFGLNENALATLARESHKPIEELKAVIKSPLGEEITKDLVIKLLTSYAAGAVKYSAYLLNFVPLLGSVVSSAITFPTTFRMLSNFLNDAADDALRVLEVAVKEDVSRDDKEHKSTRTP